MWPGVPLVQSDFRIPCQPVPYVMSIETFAWPFSFYLSFFFIALHLKKKKKKLETKTTKTMIKLCLKYFLMLEGDTCIAELNLDVLPLT